MSKKHSLNDERRETKRSRIFYKPPYPKDALQLAKACLQCEGVEGEENEFLKFSDEEQKKHLASLSEIDDAWESCHNEKDVYVMKWYIACSEDALFDAPRFVLKDYSEDEQGQTCCVEWTKGDKEHCTPEIDYAI